MSGNDLLSCSGGDPKLWLGVSKAWPSHWNGFAGMVLECWRDVKTPTSKCWCAILESKSHCNKSTHVFSFKSGGVRFALRWVSNFLELVGLSRLWVYKSEKKKHISHPQLKPKGCNGSTFRNCVLYNMATWQHAALSGCMTRSCFCFCTFVTSKKEKYRIPVGKPAWNNPKQSRSSGPFAKLQ